VVGEKTEILVLEKQPRPSIAANMKNIRLQNSVDVLLRAADPWSLDD
jgi:hypothetical protein